jgi:23S rRNA pseudouridine955/2504/2580 synthase
MKKLNFPDLIVFENEDYILINKPPFISTLTDRQTGGRQNILEMAREYRDDVQVCHRIDRETSGILALAKNPEAYRHLSMQFEHRKVQKIYHALVGGLQEFDHVLVDKPIHALSTGIVKIDHEKGKEAQTYFTTIKAFQKHTLVECRPVTGRMHQIRIHLATLRAPIVMDEQYGGKPVFLSEIKRNFNLKKDTDEQPLIQRFALHAYQLEFNLLNEERNTVTAPYPKDIQALLNQLERNL